MSPSDAEATSRLLTVLEAEERLYTELRDLLQREREYVIALDATRLEETVRRKEALAAEAHLLEESRVEVAAVLARELGASEPRPTLSRLCDLLGPRGAALGAAHSRLVALIGAVRELLDANAAFAGDALTQVRSSLRLLGRLLPADPTYQPGMLPGEPAVAAGRLVRRSA